MPTAEVKKKFTKWKEGLEEGLKIKDKNKVHGDWKRYKRKEKIRKKLM